MRSCQVLARMLPRRVGISLRVFDASRNSPSDPRRGWHRTIVPPDHRPIVSSGIHTRRFRRDGSTLENWRGRSRSWCVSRRSSLRHVCNVTGRSGEIAPRLDDRRGRDPRRRRRRRREAEEKISVSMFPPRRKNGTEGRGEEGKTSLTPGKKENTPDGRKTEHTRGEKLLHGRRPRCTSTKQKKGERGAALYVYVDAFVGRGMRHGRSHTLRHPFTNAYWLISEDHGSLERNTPAEV